MRNVARSPITYNLSAPGGVGGWSPRRRQSAQKRRRVGAPEVDYTSGDWPHRRERRIRFRRLLSSAALSSPRIF